MTDKRIVRLIRTQNRVALRSLFINQIGVKKPVPRG
jgi:hypothetical protein